MSAAALFFRLRLPDFSGPSGFYGRVARRGFGRGLAAAFFSGQPARFSFSARSLFRACSLSLFARSRVTGAGRFRRVSESADGAVPAAPADFFRAVGFLRTGCPAGLRSWAGCRPFTRPRLLFPGWATSPQTGVCVSRVGCAASPSPWCPFRCSRACRERQVLRVRVSGPNVGGRYRRIQLSSEGLSRKASRRALSSGRIYPSAAATSTSASRLQRLWFVTPASRRRSSPRRIP